MGKLGKVVKRYKHPVVRSISSGKIMFNMLNTIVNDTVLYT